jgi:hypothetical protein
MKAFSIMLKFRKFSIDFAVNESLASKNLKNVSLEEIKNFENEDPLFILN